MNKETRNAIERATQRARKLLEEDFAAQLEGDFDVHKDGALAAKAGGHLSARQAFQRERIVSAIEHKRAAGMSAAESVADYVRDAAFTTLNRFVALKMLEALELTQECITKGEQSGGYREFSGMAPGLPLLPDSAGYRLYIESIFDELSTEVKVLFDRRDPSSVLWPKRASFEQLLEILNADQLSRVWGEDETIGWVYQFFNGQDERRKMREESQAPRNGRELAVRNQFFTPRYVVQFLTDNTLGRIWYEMRGTKTVLAERCEFMVRKPGETFAPRAKKDPRDLRVLDPACGSGHFLLYAVDLLLAIYEEAYADPESPKNEVTGKTLAEDYSSVEELRKAVPSLVMEHNIHGVDIDPRCAQIAQLALWMRAQKAYRDFGIARAVRAQIRRSNIVVAEPLVADDQIAKEFVAKLGDAELGRVFTALVESLNLAGDLGLLLRVERLVGRQAKQGQTGDLFAPPEERIRAALTRFVSEEGVRASTRRRLFIDDAAHGVALFGVAEKKFDVVLMNPPFGSASIRSKKDFDRGYPRTKNDIYAAFVERGVELLSVGGRVGALTSRTGFFLSSFQSWREAVLLESAPPVVLADLGLGVMDGAMVEAAAYCLEARSLSGTKSIFLRVLEEEHDKQAALRRIIADPARAIHARARFEVDPRSFGSVARSPFAYWVSDQLRGLFRKWPLLESSGRTARRGPSTSEDARYLRCFWEVNPSASHGLGVWRSFAKGGPFARYYADIHLVADWEPRRATFLGFCGRPGREIEKPESVDCFFRAGLTWSLRTKRDLSLRAMPASCIFGHKGPAAFVEDDDEESLLLMLGLANSKAFSALVEFQLAAADAKAGGAARSYEVGVLQSTPIPSLQADSGSRLACLARRAWSLNRALDTTNESSHAFLLPSGINERLMALDRAGIERELNSIQNQIDDAAFTLYEVTAEDRAIIETASKRASSADPESDAADEDDGDEPDGAAVSADAVASWLLGVAFGRFDPRLVTGERPVPSEPEPFDPLPARSPGMYPEGDEPAERPDILVDDEGHSDDLTARVRAVAERVRVEVPENLRSWLAKEFFPFHIKMYSKSRRKAPIYWQLATPSASYSVWLYIHAFSSDTFFRVQNDYAAPKLAHEERRLESLTREMRDKATAAQRNELAVQESVVEELRAFLDEVKRIAPLWNPNLDDGVIINFAPLWRLVPQNRSWQKELKSAWDALRDGKYDWAHLALHLWPERVVPKCATDRSLAIAHGLEDVFWVEGADGKWTARKAPTRSVDELVRERTSPAVKSALKSVLEAPTTNGKSAARALAGRRETAAVAEGGDA